MSSSVKGTTDMCKSCHGPISVDSRVIAWVGGTPPCVEISVRPVAVVCVAPARMTKAPASSVGHEWEREGSAFMAGPSEANWSWSRGLFGNIRGDGQSCSPRCRVRRRWPKPLPEGRQVGQLNFPEDL